MFPCLFQTSSQFFRQQSDVWFLDYVDMVAGNFVRLNAPTHKFAPAVAQVIVSRQISGQKEGHVSAVRLRQVIFHRGKVDLLDVLQCRGQSLPIRS